MNELPTPCLLLDMERCEANIETMRRQAARHSIALRPHAKSHKCVELARRQIAAGALGVCVATVAEAEVMARAGIRGLLITSELAGKPKIARLMEVVAQQQDTAVVVDDPENVRELGEAAAARGLRLSVLIDLDVGSNRTGVPSGDCALALAHAISKAPNLRLLGLSAYAAHASHTTGFEARQASSRQALRLAGETWDMLARDGFELEILSGGCTGTYNIDPPLAILTELQVGSYVFMDADYRRIGGEKGELFDDFSPALTVLATVIHRSGTKAVLDAGFKALATDRACGPELVDLHGANYRFYGDEHGVLTLNDPSREVRLGDRIELIVPNCDPNVNLYNCLFCIRGRTVEAVWPVMERGGAPFF